MKIGVDIDNCLSNFNDYLFKEYLKHDKELRNTGIINENADYIREGMFDWTKQEEEEFYYTNIEEWAKNFEPIEKSVYYIRKLKEDGNEIYIITGRENGEYTNPFELTKNWLEEHKFIYDKLILTNAYDSHAKTKVCIENNVDIMIEDSIRISLDLKNNGVNVLTMNTKYNQKEKSLDRVSTWKEIYERITNISKKQEKINVILDTDTYNECDDQFAISYILKLQNIFNIEAITVAPFSHNSLRKVSANQSQDLSYNEIIKICKLNNFNCENKVFKGSTDYISNGYSEENDAVNKIIEISLKNDKTYILAIGAITNIALAIKKEPSIIDKIEIVWLGGNELGYKDNLEYNFRQDIEAVKIVFNSNVKLTVIPCKNVASILEIDINTLNEKMKDNELNRYLKDRFYNDGYHGILEKRVIWDISVIAYMINKDWFETKNINLPIIAEDTSYKLTNSERKIEFVIKINKEKVYEDLFKKLGENI